MLVPYRTTSTKNLERLCVNQPRARLQANVATETGSGLAPKPAQRSAAGIFSLPDWSFPLPGHFSSWPSMVWADWLASRHIPSRFAFEPNVRSTSEDPLVAELRV